MRLVCPLMFFSTLYTKLPHNLIKEKFLDLIEGAFKKIFKNEGTLYLVCNDKKAFYTSIDLDLKHIIRIVIKLNL